MIHQYFNNRTLFACVDLEATCCDDNSFPRNEMEIIEIGCTVMSPELEIIGSFDSFVRPTIHTTLTPFCKELTTIKQNDVDNADTWDVVAGQLDEYLDDMCGSSLGMLWLSWGDFDRNVIARECKRWNIEDPMPPIHYNLKALDAAHRNTKKERGLRGAISGMGLKFPGTLHRACDDAKAVAFALQALAPGLTRSKL